MGASKLRVDWDVGCHVRILKNHHNCSIFLLIFRGGHQITYLLQGNQSYLGQSPPGCRACVQAWEGLNALSIAIYELRNCYLMAQLKETKVGKCTRVESFTPYHPNKCIYKFLRAFVHLYHIGSWTPAFRSGYCAYMCRGFYTISAVEDMLMLKFNDTVLSQSYFGS